MTQASTAGAGGNGDASPPPDGTWYDREEAAQHAGYSLRQFVRREKEKPVAGVKTTGKGPKAKRWYPELELDEWIDENAVEHREAEVMDATAKMMREAARASQEVHKSGGIALQAGATTIAAMDNRTQILFDSLIKENTRLGGENHKLAEENRNLRTQQQTWMDQLAEQARNDRQKDLELRQKEELFKSGQRMFEYAVPAGMAMLGKRFGIEMGGAAQDAVMRIVGQLDDEKKTKLMAAIASAGALDDGQLGTLGMLFQRSGKPEAAAPNMPGVAKAGAPPDSAPWAERRAYWQAKMDAEVKAAQKSADEAGQAEKKIEALMAEAEAEKKKNAEKKSA